MMGKEKKKIGGKGRRRGWPPVPPNGLNFNDMSSVGSNFHLITIPGK